MFYTPAADELRDFFRDKLGFQYTDTGGGWLIFTVPVAEIGCHPSDRKYHDLTFFCDDLQKTIDDLKRRGVEFTAGIKDEEWGLVTRFKVPGRDEVGLYQPKYKMRPAASRPRAQQRTRRAARKRVRS